MLYVNYTSIKISFLSSRYINSLGRVWQLVPETSKKGGVNCSYETGRLIFSLFQRERVKVREWRGNDLMVGFNCGQAMRCPNKPQRTEHSLQSTCPHESWLLDNVFVEDFSPELTKVLDFMSQLTCNERICVKRSRKQEADSQKISQFYPFQGQGQEEAGSYLG